MSSYFDNAARIHQELPNTERKLKLTEAVVKRVDNYLTYIAEHSPATHQQMVHDFRQKFDKARVQKEWDEDGRMVIEELHNLAHEIGTARIPVKYQPKRRFGDNPYYEEHYGQEEVPA